MVISIDIGGSVLRSVLRSSRVMAYGVNLLTELCSVMICLMTSDLQNGGGKEDGLAELSRAPSSNSSLHPTYTQLAHRPYDYRRFG